MATHGRWVNTQTGGFSAWASAPGPAGPTGSTITQSMETKVLLGTPLAPLASNLGFSTGGADEILLRCKSSGCLHVFVILFLWQIKEQLEADTVTVVDASGDGRHIW